jgi:hypothetical protein
MADPTPRVDLAADMRRRAGMDPADAAPEQQPAAAADAERDAIVADERQRAIGIINAAELAGRQDLASDLISGPGSVGDAVRALEKARRTARGPGRA